MMQNTARLILCLLAGHVFMVNARISYNKCEPEEFAKCNRVFAERFENADENENVLDTYCDAYKAKVQSLASNAKCTGKAIDFLRFAVLQHVIMNIKSGACPSMDLKPLRKVAQGYEEYQMKIDGLKDLEEDKFQPCAAKKDIYCVSRYAEEMKNGGNVCQALPNYFKCYESKGIVCDDDTYKDYIAKVIKSAKEVNEIVKKFPYVMPGCESR